MTKLQCKQNARFYLKAAFLCPFQMDKDRYLDLAAAWMVMWSEAAA